jgi:hypothetical protein
MRKQSFQILRQIKTINKNKKMPNKIARFVGQYLIQTFSTAVLTGCVLLSCANIAIAEITPNSTINFDNGLRKIILTPKNDVRLLKSEVRYDQTLPHVHTNTGSNTFYRHERPLSLMEFLHHAKPQTADVNAILTSPLLGEGLYGGSHSLNKNPKINNDIDVKSISMLKSIDKNLNSVNVRCNYSTLSKTPAAGDLTPLFASKSAISI